MSVKNMFICFIIGIGIGCAGTGAIGYHWIVRQDRIALEFSRREAEEYRSRAFLSEERLRSSINIIETGEGKLTGSIGTIREAIGQIREIKLILQEVKKNLIIPVDGDNR